jgi:toxin ParE1/3/4
MPTFRLTKRAKQDLKEIGHYTQEVWGREQRNKYLAELDSTFHDLAKTPQKGRGCEEIRTGYRKYQVNRHVIYYRQTTADIEIIRILHDRMDAEAHLSLDEEE